MLYDSYSLTFNTIKSYKLYRSELFNDFNLHLKLAGFKKMKFSDIFTEFCTVRTVDSQGILTDNKILDDYGYPPTESEFLNILKENKKTKKIQWVHTRGQL